MEYTTVLVQSRMASHYDFPEAQSALDEALNKMASNGWRFEGLTAVNTDGTLRTFYTLVFSRPAQ